MYRKRPLALLLALLLTLSLSGCGKKAPQADASAEPERSAEASAPAAEEEPPQREQEAALPFALGYYDGLGLNPYTCDNAQNQSLMGLLYEPLFELDQSFTAQPVLAESITAKPRTEQRVISSKKDKKTVEQGETEEKAKTQNVDVTDVTVTLRKGAKFSDGTRVCASDVVASLERAAAKGSVYRSRLGSIQNLSAHGKSQVSFTIDSGAQSAAELLDVPIVKSGSADSLFPVGSGPYTVVLNKKGRPVRLNASESWWRLGEEYQVALSKGVNAEAGGEGVITKTIALPLQRIRLYTASDSDELIFGFTSGAVTAVSSRLTSSEALRYTGSYDVTDYPTSDLLYLGCNTAKGPCQDQKLRSAIYRSVNRARIVERMMAGHALEARLPVPEGSGLWDEALWTELAYDLDTAQQLCKDTGVTSELTLIVNSESEFKAAVAREAAKELETAGLNVRCKQLSWKEYKAALAAGDYDLCLGEVVLRPNFDLSDLIAPGGSLNFDKYQSDALTAAERTYRRSGRDTRGEAARQLFTLLSQEAPVVPVCFRCDCLLSRSGVVARSSATQSNLFHALWDWTLDESVVQASNGE